jgi:hypothetical protein
LPADEGLEADEQTRLDVHFGLIVKQKLLVFDGTPELRFERQLLGDASIHVWRVEHVASASAARILERGFRVADEAVRRLPVCRKQRDARTRGNSDFGSLNGEALPEVLSDLVLDEACYVGFLVHRSDQHRESIAVEARKRVLRSHDATQPIGDLHQKVVACRPA